MEICTKCASAMEKKFIKVCGELMNLNFSVTGWSEKQIKIFVMFCKIKKCMVLQQKIYTEFMKGTEKLCADCRN